MNGIRANNNTLRVAAANIKYLFEHPKIPKDTPKGIEGRVLDTLMRALGMEYTLVPSNDIGSLHPNGTWSGTVGLVYKGEADLGITSVSITEERSRVVDFSVPYMFTKVTFSTDLPERLPRSYAYIYPFDLTTWSLILGMMLTLPILSGVLFGSRDFARVWLGMFGNVLGRSVPMGKRLRVPEMVFVLFWWSGAVTISFCYSAVLSSFLLVPLLEDPPNDFRELAREVREGRYEVYVIRDSFFSSQLASAEGEDFRTIHEAVVRNGWYMSIPESIARGTYGPGIAKIGSDLHIEVFFGRAPFATKHYSKTGFRAMYQALVLSKKLASSFKTKLDGVVRRIGEAGLMDKFVDDHIYHVWGTSGHAEEVVEMVHPLSVDEIFGAVIVLLVGWTLSSFVLVVEVLHSHFKQERRSYQKKP